MDCCHGDLHKHSDCDFRHGGDLGRRIHKWSWHSLQLEMSCVRRLEDAKASWQCEMCLLIMLHRWAGKHLWGKPSLEGQVGVLNQLLKYYRIGGDSFSLFPPFIHSPIHSHWPPTIVIITSSIGLCYNNNGGLSLLTCLSHYRDCVQPSVNIRSLKLNNTYKVKQILFPFYQQRNWNIEKLITLPTGTQLKNGEARIQIR